MGWVILVLVLVALLLLACRRIYKLNQDAVEYTPEYIILPVVSVELTDFDIHQQALKLSKEAISKARARNAERN